MAEVEHTPRGTPPLHASTPIALTRPLTMPVNHHSHNHSHYQNPSPVLSPAAPATDFSRAASSLPHTSAHTPIDPLPPAALPLPFAARPTSNSIDRDRSLDAVLRKLLGGLKSRSNDYCKKLVACAEHAIEQLDHRVGEYHSHDTKDILNFTGIPYAPPSEPEVPSSPSNAGSPTASNAHDNPLSPSHARSPASPTHSPSFAGVLSTPYVTDLCVHYGKIRPKTTTSGFTLMERTISGIHRANVNKGGSSVKVHLGYKRSIVTQLQPQSAAVTDRPLTSISIFIKNRANEESPYGFSPIEKNDSGDDGCLHPTTSTTNNQRQPYLSLHRGEGAPITHVALISRAYKETLPSGNWHEIKQTLLGNRADLSVNVQDGQAMYLCFRVDIKPIIARWRDLAATAADTDSINGSDNDNDSVHYCRLFALLSSMLYSYDEKLIKFTYDVFRKLDRHAVPPVMINAWGSMVCDATPLFLTYFSTTGYSDTLHLLLYIFRQCFSVLSIDTAVKIVDACLRLRHEDKQHKISEGLIDAVLDGMRDKLKPCQCEKFSNHHSSGNHSNGNGADSGASTPAPMSPSSTNQASSPPYSQHPISSSIAGQLCNYCVDRELLERASSVNDYARTLVTLRAEEVTRQLSLNDDVRSYRRHHTVYDPLFRYDVANTIAKLMSQDIATAAKRANIGASGVAVNMSQRNRGPRFNFNSINGLRASAGELIREETEENLASENDVHTNTSTPIKSVFVSENGMGGNGRETLNESKDGSEIAKFTVTMSLSSDVDANRAVKFNNSPIIANGNLLLPPSHRIHDDGDEDEDGEDSVISSSAFESQSEFIFPEFHEDEDEDGNEAKYNDDDDDDDDDGEDSPDSETPAPERSSGTSTPVDANVTIANTPILSSQPAPANVDTDEPGAAMTGIVPGELSTSPSLSLSSDAVMPMNLMSPLDDGSAFEHGAEADDDREEKVSEVDRIYSHRKHERLLLTLALAWSKASTEPAPFGLKDSETLRRKQHSLQLLLTLLTKSQSYFKSSLSSSLALKRFLLPSLMSASITDNMPTFRLILQLLSVLYERFHRALMTELGSFIYHILLPLLDNPLCSAVQKTAIVEIMLLSFFKSPSSVVQLYYNYDNAAKNWKIFDKLVSTLTAIVKGGKTVSEDDNDLQRAALKLLVHLLEVQAQWIGVPGLHRPVELRTRPLLDEDSKSPSLSVPAPTDSSSSRRPSWSARNDGHLDEAKVLAKALELAKTNSLKAALQYLKSTDPQYAKPDEMAQFLYLTPELDKVEVGDFLSSTTDKFMKHEDYKRLRQAYIHLLDFTGLSLDAALRSFLCDSNFRLPGESQKIDRLLDAFCEAYIRDNPNVFKNFDAALTLTFALVMLNTDAHDPRLKGNPSRKQMTLEQFVRNLRGTNDGEDFPRPLLVALYHNIQADEIKWTEGGEPKRSEAEIRLMTKKSFEVIVRKSLAYVKNHHIDALSWQYTDDTNIVRGMFSQCWEACFRALEARTKESADNVETLHICLDGLAYGATIAIVLSLPNIRREFDQQLAIITFTERERNGPVKKGNLSQRLIEREHLKQDWYRPFNLMCDRQPAHACHIIFQQTHEVKALIGHERAQAQLKRIETEFGGEIALVEPHRTLVKQGRLLKVSSNGKKIAYHFMLFNDLIVYASEGMNQRYKLHRVIHLSLCRLEDLRSDKLPHAIRLVSPQKSFTVLCSDSNEKKKWVDALLTNLQQVYEKRRRYIEAAHQQDMKSLDTNVGKGVTLTPSSRASPVPTPPSSSSPTSPSRKDLIRMSSSMDFSVGNVNSVNLAGASSKGSEHQLRRYSTFIGSSEFDLNSRNADAAGSQTRSSLSHCKLCIRPFNSIFRRRYKCRWCNDLVCQDCSKNKHALPGQGPKLQQVCDACYGALKGMIGEETKMLTIVTEEKPTATLTTANTSTSTNTSITTTSRNTSAINPPSGEDRFDREQLNPNAPPSTKPSKPAKVSDRRRTT